MIKVLSLFSGIGAFEKALERQGIDYQLVNYCEIDKYASKSYSLVHNVSEQLNLGDITQVDSMDLDDDIDLITHGSPCFTGNTLVLTQDGYKAIKDVHIGDYVLDKNNEYSKVLNFFPQGKKEIWKINAMSVDCIETTENHMFLVRKKYKVWNNEKRIYERKFEQPCWKECKDISSENDYLGIAINQNAKLPKYNGVTYTRGKTQYIKKELDMCDTALWYLAGRYLGDGWTRKRKERGNHLSSVVICCGKHKSKKFETMIEDYMHYTKIEERTVFKYTFVNRELAEFMAQFGRGAKNKRIPGFVFDLPIACILALLQGYWDSDGCVNSQGYYCATSISRELIYGLGQLVAKVFHAPYSIYYSKKPSKYVIEGRTVNQNDTWQLKFKMESKKQDKAFYKDGYIWIPIKEVTNTKTFKEVYDIEIENSHSFTANGIIVHNCQDFSIAGKQAGGDEGTNTRSSLMWNTVNIVKDIKPKVVLWENVKNLLSEKHRHNFDSYIQIMDELGYNSYYKVLNAKDFGIPQNRERVYTVSIRKDIDNGMFKFPEPFELKLRLKDVLEDSVDEKYYLSDEYLQRFLNSHLKMNGDIKIVGTTVGTGKGTNSRHWVHDTNGIVGTLSATDYKQPKQILETKRLGGVFDTEKSKHQAGSVYDKDGLSPTLDTMQGGWRQPCIFINKVKEMEVLRIRKLTPRECWRLMGFDDSDFDKVKGKLSDTQLYKQAGNSIVVNVLEAIYKQLFKVVKL